MRCENDCGEARREIMGCGFRDEFSGKSTNEHFKTCPQWCILQPEVGYFYKFLKDYQRGALGNVMRLNKPFWEYMQALDNERNRWEVDQAKNATKQI